MAYPAPFTQAQLEIAVGGADNLIQLVDKGQSHDLDTPACQAFIAEVQAAAASELYSILQVVFDPGDPRFQEAVFVQQHSVTIGVYWAWHKSTAGRAIPEDVKIARSEAIAALKEAREGIRSLGSDADVGSNVGVKTVEVDRTGTRVIRKNMGGFC